MTARHIIVGASGAADDEAVVAWSIAECRHDGSRLVIAHACSRSRGDEPEEMSVGLAGHPGLTEAVNHARRELGTDRVTVRVEPLPPGGMLVNLATAADLLVVGPPDRGGWTHWGSTTHYVTRHAPCPVVIARPTREASSHATFAGHVVVGVDGSGAAHAGLGFAFAYAEAHHLPVAAVTVARSGVQDLWYDDQLLETHLTAEPAALELLSTEVEAWERAYPTVWVKRVVFAGRPLDGLLRAADGATMLVLGTHARRRGPRVLLGSTSLDAIARAACPVAILQPPSVAIDNLHPYREVHDVQT
jgi:nucleotide-binding universal stress UspA family protein